MQGQRQGFARGAPCALTLLYFRTYKTHKSFLKSNVATGLNW